MTNEELILVTAAAAKEATGQLGGLGQVLSDLSGKLRKLLTGMSLVRYLTDAAVSTGRLNEELTQLKASLARLRTTLGNALAPLFEALLPVIRSVVNAVVRTMNYLGRLTQVIFGTEDASKKAAQGQDALAAATGRAAKAASRSLASFDQLNRLQAGTQTDIAADPGTTAAGQDASMELNLQEFIFVETIQQMLDALKSLDFAPVITLLQGIWQALQPFGELLCQGLYWAYWNVLLPMSQWAVETLLPVLLETLRLGLVALNGVIEDCRPALRFLWEQVFKPLGQWAADKLVEGLEWLQEKLDVLSLWLENNQIPIQWVLNAGAAILAAILLINGAMSLFNSRTSTGTGMVQLMTAALLAMAAPIQAITALLELLNTCLLTLGEGWKAVRTESQGVVQNIRNDWQGIVNWFQTDVLGRLRDSFRTAINSIIGFFNTMLSGITSGINNLISALNRVSFTVPDWVPELGGSTFGISLSTVRTPQIPLLAQGAVLPANRPFLAMVGDQRHGTNIEAPLETIQQAVALVLEDMVSGQMAGQEAVVAVLRQILEAVLGISIGDADIARAVDRYRAKTAVITGG